MSDRKLTKDTQQSEPKLKKGAKKQLFLMILSVFLMIFSITQVYHIVRYTLGYEVQEKHLRIYNWVTMLVNYKK